MSKEFGRRLSLQLKQQGFTQKQFAESTHVTEAAISRYISGDREPMAGSLANIASALHISSDYLLGIETEVFDFAEIRRIIAKTAPSMTEQQKRELASTLLGGELRNR